MTSGGEAPLLTLENNQLGPSCPMLREVEGFHNSTWSILPSSSDIPEYYSGMVGIHPLSLQRFSLNISES